MLTKTLVESASESRKYLDLADYSFLIESQHRDQKVLFDLAFMQDLDTRMPPSLRPFLAGPEKVMGIDAAQDIPGTLQLHNIPLSTINAIIWSHSHIDHVGDPSVFPRSTALVVGPSFKAHCIPGFPSNPHSSLLDSAFHGRHVHEVDFSTVSATTIGGFRAVDYFGDSSVWLLEACGHTEHHMCALCRTTDESWILLAGDACHHIAQLRPNRFRPLPDDGVPAAIIIRGEVPSSPEQCGHLHPRQYAAALAESSFYGLAPGMQEDPKAAEETLERLKAFDGRDDVMVIIAHDASLLTILDFFPGNLNGWKAKGWDVQGRWLFLNDFVGAVSE